MILFLCDNKAGMLKAYWPAALIELYISLRLPDEKFQGELKTRTK